MPTIQKSLQNPLNRVRKDLKEENDFQNRVLNGEKKGFGMETKNPVTTKNDATFKNYQEQSKMMLDQILQSKSRSNSRSSSINFPQENLEV